MQKQKNIQLAVIGVLAFAVLFMSIGFAAYSQVLNIGGVATVGANKWSVHFDPNSYQLGEGSVKEKSKTITNDGLSYEIELKNPGDYYLFQIDAINDGTLNAVLDSIQLNGLTKDTSRYISYTVKYDDQIFNQSENNDLRIALPSATGVNRKVVMVKVSYDKVDGIRLPENPVILKLSAAFSYSQND